MNTIFYYKVRRDMEAKYIVYIYYRGILGTLKEWHQSVHNTPAEVNEVIKYYRNKKKLVMESIARA